jgi:hypothetical protein
MPESSFPRERNPNWQGGRKVDKRGYVYINVGRDHPMAGTTPYVAEHRLVMAEMLGRWLTWDEIVHHIDEDKGNNDPSNLELKDRASHMRAHYAGKPRPSAKAQARKDGRWVALPRQDRERKRLGKPPAPLESRLWPKIDRSGGDDACHPWMSVRNPFGYGKFWVEGKSKDYAHRVVYEVLNGKIEDPSLVVRHTCDNPPCCNPKHLVLGTRGDNNRDRGERRRGREHRQHGEANANVKIKDTDLPRIFELRDAGWTQMRIAEEFGVKQPQISRILLGRQRSKGSS